MTTDRRVDFSRKQNKIKATCEFSPNFHGPPEPNPLPPPQPRSVVVRNNNNNIIVVDRSVFFFRRWQSPSRNASHNIIIIVIVLGVAGYIDMVVCSYECYNNVLESWRE